MRQQGAQRVHPRCRFQLSIFQFFNFDFQFSTSIFNKVHGEFTLDAVVAKFNELASERIEKSEEHGWSEKVEEEVEKSKSSTPMSD